jgi:DNA topoisomerase-1
MPDTLIVVESPAKAKSIAKMLGSGYVVKASKGHVADLPERELGVQVDADFAPQYEVKKDKRPLLEELKRLAQGHQVLIATDPDREGEAIGWHVARLLELDPQAPIRVEFHEITPRVVREALRKTRPIDQRLVDAQQARRVLDRLVGYQLSPLLALEFRKRALSAGRVQSVALRLLVEREAEIEAFQPQEYWTVELHFEQEAPFTANLYSVSGRRVLGEAFLLTSKEEVEKVLQRIEQVSDWRISEIEVRERRRSPAPPFTTSTLQQAASNRLGWTAGRTMRVAQRLYEGIDLPEGTVGLITYMRTDSLHIAPEALAEVRREIQKRFGAPYLPDQPHTYRTKNALAQEAHEAIRPTQASRHPEMIRSYLSEEEYRLYDLIWRRFVASQMNPALFEQTTVTVQGGEFEARASGSVLRFDGFLRVWGSEEKEGELPALHQGPVQLLQALPEQHFTEPPPRYTDASLVKTLEELGIGRPSTYAPTLETLEKRGYLERQGRSLKPTPLGQQVIAYLREMFPKIIAYDFTARMEERLDAVEAGQAPWPQVVREFYEPFLEEFQRVPKKTCPLCGRPLELKVSRYGQFLGCTGYPECRYTEPLEQRKAPEPLGELCPKCHQGHLVRKFGRYGSFVSCDRYPECDYTRDEAPPTSFRCPKCHEGQILEKRSKRGKPYYRCDRCDFLSFDPLLPSTCSLCGWNEVSHGKKIGCSNPDCSRYLGPSLKTQAPKKTRRPSKSQTATRTRSKIPFKELIPFLSQLAPDEAELVRRTQGEQTRLAQAAEALHLEPQAAQKTLQRALLKLRRAYKKHLEQTPA